MGAIDIGMDMDIDMDTGRGTFVTVGIGIAMQVDVRPVPSNLLSQGFLKVSCHVPVLDSGGVLFCGPHSVYGI